MLGLCGDEYLKYNHMITLGCKWLNEVLHKMQFRLLRIGLACRVVINTPTYNDPSSKLCIHVLFSSKIAKKANFVGCCNRLNLRLSYNLLGRFYIAMSCHVPTVTVIAVICGSQSPSWKVDTVRSRPCLRLWIRWRIVCLLPLFRPMLPFLMWCTSGVTWPELSIET